ncbi:MAG: hypothetical protein IJ642_09030 [Oscillospiraceae bacterium]|nr:hypothetical protein [Oscillospiraceae bacterium]
MIHHQKQESEIRLTRPKHRLFIIFLILIFIFILFSTIFYDTVYAFFTSFYEDETTETVPSKSSFALKYNGYDLTANARQNLIKEFQSYNIQYTDYNFYAQRGRLLDKNGDVIYSIETKPVLYTSFYEQSRNRVCEYLYGDLPGTEGISPLMRAVPNINPDSLADTLPEFPTGYDIQLFLNPELEMQIYDLLEINHIKGGCIIQDLPTGQIEVMTATSVTSTESEKSGLTQLEACLNSDFLSEAIQNAAPEEQEKIKKYFDYQVQSAEFSKTDPETEEQQKILKYCFTTDFDLIFEQPDNMKKSDDSEISPLHLNSITQRIFSGISGTPLLIDKILDQQGREVRLLPDYPVTEISELSIQNRLKSEYEAYHSESHKDYQISVMKYQPEKYADFKYITGVILSKDKKIQKAFTLYSKDEKILQFTDSIVYFINKEYAQERSNASETETVSEGE